MASLRPIDTYLPAQTPHCNPANRMNCLPPSTCENLESCVIMFALWRHSTRSHHAASSSRSGRCWIHAGPSSMEWGVQQVTVEVNVERVPGEEQRYSSPPRSEPVCTLKNHGFLNLATGFTEPLHVPNRLVGSPGAPPLPHDPKQTVAPRTLGHLSFVLCPFVLGSGLGYAPTLHSPPPVGAPSCSASETKTHQAG